MASSILQSESKLDNLVMPFSTSFIPADTASTFIKSQPLALLERDKWVRLLKAFDRGDYRSKAETYGPSFEYILDRVETHTGKALDAGCGSGLLGRSLLQRGWQVEGIDILPEAVKMSSSYFTTRNCDIAETIFKPESFDLVVCGMVLMLLKDIEPAIAELSRIMKPGAFMILGVLNPAYYKTNQSCSNNLQSTSLGKWSFLLADDTNIEITYYRHGMKAYFHNVRRYFCQSTWFQVHHDGHVIGFVDSNELSSASEFIWALIQK